MFTLVKIFSYLKRKVLLAEWGKIITVTSQCHVISRHLQQYVADALPKMKQLFSPEVTLVVKSEAPAVQSHFNYLIEINH